MPNDEQDKAGVIAPPPLIYLGALIFGLLLGRRFPIPFLPRRMARGLGWPLLGGVLLLGWFERAMRQADTPTSPYKPGRAHSYGRPLSLHAQPRLPRHARRRLQEGLGRLRRDPGARPETPGQGRTSSSRSYWEGAQAGGGPFDAFDIPTLPVAVTVFPAEIYRAPRSWGERAFGNLIYWNEVDKGGHFAAWEQPELFSEEVRAAYKSLR
jgi:pimeloyl-ACP methyl ester carboxylesterase